MKKKRALAWILAGSLVMSNSSFAVFAEEIVSEVDVQEIEATEVDQTDGVEQEMETASVMEVEVPEMEETELESPQAEEMETESAEAEMPEASETDLAEVEEQILGDSDEEFFFDDTSMVTALEEGQTDQYRVDLWSEFETGNMLPGMTVTLAANTQHGFVNEDGFFCWEPEEEVYYQWAVEEKEPLMERECPVSITPDPHSGNTCQASASKDSSDYCVIVTCTSYEDEAKTKMIAQEQMELYVNSQFYKIVCSNRETLEGLKPGESAQIEASLLYYDVNAEEQEKTVDANQVTYAFSWNEEMVQITDADNKTLTEGETGQAPFTVKRIANDDTDVEILAKVGEETIADTSWHMNSYEYGVWYEELRNWEDQCTWVFDNEEDYTLSLNTENLKAYDNISIQWVIGRWNESKEKMEAEVPSSEKCYTVSEDGTQITLHGSELAKRYPAGDEGYFYVFASVYAGDVLVNDILLYVEVWSAIYDYYQPLSEPGDRNMLRDFSIWMDNRINVYVQDGDYPWGDEVETTLDIECLAQYTWDEDGNEVLLQKEDDPVVRIDEEENGWTFHGLRDGFVRLKLIWDSVEQEGQFVIYGEKENECFEINVGGGKTNLIMDYPDRDNRMLQNSEMEVWTTLDNEWLDEDGGYHCEEIKDYYLVIETDENGSPCYDTDVVDVEIKDGTKVLVKSKNRTGGGNVSILAMNPETEEEIGRANLYYDVRDSYYRIILKDDNGNKTEPENPIIGETLDLNTYEMAILYMDAEHSWDNPGQLTEEEKLEFRVRLLSADEGGYNSEVLELVEPEDDTKVYPLLKRVSSDGETHLQLAVEHRKRDENGDICYDDDEKEIWEEWGRNEWYLEGYDYSTEFVEVRYPEDDSSVVFSDEDDYILSLNPENLMEGENLRKEVQIEWLIGTWDEESETIVDLLDEKAGYYEADGATITLKGSKLAEVYVPGENSWFSLEAHIKVNGYDVAGCGMGIEVCDPVYEYDFPLNDPGENEVLPGWWTNFGSEMECWVRNKEHINGERIQTYISKAEILGYGYDFDWGKYEKGEAQSYPEDMQPIGTLVGNAEDGWTFTAKEFGEDGFQYGYAHVQVTYTSLENGTEDTYDFPIFVGTQHYELSYRYPDGVQSMLTEDEILVETSLYGWFIDDEGVYREGEITDYTLQITDENGKPMYDTDIISAEVVNGTQLRICSKANCTGTDIWVNVIGTNWYGDQNEYLTGNQTSIYVDKEYYYLTPVDRKTNPLLQQTLDLNEWEMAVYKKTTDCGTVEMEGIQYQIEYDSDIWEEKESTQEGALPQLIRKKSDGTQVVVIAMSDQSEDGSEEWNEVTRRYFWFDDITDQYSLDYIYSYGSRCDQCAEDGVVTSRALTDIPLVLTLDTSGLHGLKDYEIQWYLYHWDDETQQEIKAEAVTYQIAKDKASISLSGKEAYLGDFTDVIASVWYDGKEICGTWTHVMTDSCEHQWTKGTITKQATCTATGTLVKTCEHCGGKKTEIIPALGHTGGQATCIKAAVCSRCKKTYGSLLKRTYKLTASSITLKVKQSTSAFCITGLARGDSIKSIRLNSEKYAALSNVNLKKGTFTIKALKKKGNATLYITLASPGNVISVPVKIQTGTVKTEKVTFAQKALTLTKGSSKIMTPAREPFTTTEKITYTTSDKKVVKITSQSGGKSVKLTAAAPGTAKITAKSGKKKAECVVTVPGIGNVKSSVTVKRKKATVLKPKLYGIKGKVTYISSNPTVAAVDANGKITGVKKGSATITVKCGSYAASCKVKVK